MLSQGQEPQTGSNLSIDGISSHPFSSTARFDTILILILGLLVCGTAISARSYWLDEAESVCVAILPTMAKAWGHVRADAAANLQVPFYFLFAWLWEKLAGPGEFAMRAGNALWFLLGILALARATAEKRPLCWSISLVVLVSPFAWYYLDEARPYAMQLGASLTVFASLYRLGLCQGAAVQQRRWVLVLCLGSVLLASSGLLAMLWLGAYLFGTLISTPKQRLRELAKAYPLPWAATFATFLVVGLYYLWTLSLGARAARTSMDLKTAMFIPYEHLGFSGLGPGRLDLRANGPAALRAWLPLLVLYGVILLSVMAAGWRQIALLTSRRTRISWAVSFFCVTGYILAVGLAVQFRVLGRHFMPLLPVPLAILGFGVADLLRRGSWGGRAIAGAFLVLSLVSCLNLRLSDRHAKDDYRSAAALGREALVNGETVWWGADKQAALIYHLPLADPPGAPHMAIFLDNPIEGFEKSLPPADVVLTSKRDIYDAVGVLNKYLVRSGFQAIKTFPAFTVWRAPTKK
jgi:hypothetical protein